MSSHSSKQPVLGRRGGVRDQLADELAGYTMTKSALHFPIDRPLPKPLVKKLIAVRLADLGRRLR